MSSPVEVENTATELSSQVIDSDVHSQFQELHSKVKELEREKKEISDKYDAQRANLHKLYLQKESELEGLRTKKLNLETKVDSLVKELDEAKSQLCVAGLLKENEVEAEKKKAEAEIAALNEIVNESVTTSQSEVKKLKQIIHMLELQVNKLRGEKEKEGLLLAPSNVISGAKSLARKVVGQLGNDSDFRSHDNLEDSMKKAQEDAEVLKSLVIPLEKKIHELSEKLAVAEKKLKKYESGDARSDTSPNNISKNEKNAIDSSCNNASQESGAVSPKRFPDSKSPLKDGGSAPFAVEGQFRPTSSAASPSKNISCDMCINYEAQLVTQQQLTRQLEKQKEIIEANMEKFKEDLIKEIQFRKSMEDKWNENKEEHKMQVTQLKSLYESAENEMKNLYKVFEQFRKGVEEELSRLKFDREKISAELQELQKENDNLMGKYIVHSEQLRNESINFPDNVEDLQELLLKSHEELIAAKVAEETKEEQLKTLKYEIELLREQMNNDMLSKNEMETSFTLENTVLREKLDKKERESLTLLCDNKTLHASAREKEELIKVLQSKVDALTEDKRVNEESISKLRSRVTSLQQELETTETVQQDFVRLSQSLQIELEKIRGANTEVRWQHDEDAVQCLGCKNPFTSGKRKAHCRHCGKIFCSTCLSCTVFSGPNERPSQVCQVCHTLLNCDTAPYFSQDPPH